MGRFLILQLILSIVICNNQLQSQNVRYIDSALVADTLRAGGKLYNCSDTTQYVYFMPSKLGFLKYSFQDMYLLGREAVKEENRWAVAGITASTIALVVLDEPITNTVQQFCRYINLSQDNKTYNLSPSKDVPLYVPVELSSGLYYIGDGITEMAVNSGFYIYGAIKHDNRALQTATQITEGFIAVGLWVQILKHISGRATAYSNNNRDTWQWFTDIRTYQSSVPSFDAFPSGHLATAMMTTTVIAMNYPEYRFIKPLAYSLMALCGFQMINNGVHWAGDYPLAIAMGYAIGKIAVNRGRFQVISPSSHRKRASQTSFGFHPRLYNQGAGISLSLKF